MMGSGYGPGWRHHQGWGRGMGMMGRGGMMGPGNMHSGMMMRVLFAMMDSDDDGAVSLQEFLRRLTSGSSRQWTPTKMAASPWRRLCEASITLDWRLVVRHLRLPRWKLAEDLGEKRRLRTNSGVGPDKWAGSAQPKRAFGRTPTS